MLFQCVTVLMMVMECVQRMRFASIAIVWQKVLRFLPAKAAPISRNLC